MMMKNAKPEVPARARGETGPEEHETDDLIASAMKKNHFSAKSTKISNVSSAIQKKEGAWRAAGGFSSHFFTSLRFGDTLPRCCKLSELSKSAQRCLRARPFGSRILHILCNACFESTKFEVFVNLARPRPSPRPPNISETSYRRFGRHAAPQPPLRRGAL